MKCRILWKAFWVGESEDGPKHRERERENGFKCITGLGSIRSTTCPRARRIEKTVLYCQFFAKRKDLLVRFCPVCMNLSSYKKDASS